MAGGAHAFLDFVGEVDQIIGGGGEGVGGMPAPDCAFADAESVGDFTDARAELATGHRENSVTEPSVSVDRRVGESCPWGSKTLSAVPRAGRGGRR